ncbi:MAG TPA: Ig-like domain-containing protein [Gemmatimonadaceae bacterium]|nr:Ig-like domain-containing protein [Gemmatimonadaceae bacterium]
MTYRLGALTRAGLCVASLFLFASCSDTKASNITGPDAEGARSQRRNYPPTVWITTPDNATTVAQGTSVSFTGGASDTRDGELSGASLSWKSDRDGAIGTGTAFNKSDLSVGAHVITLTAMDSQGATATHSRTLTISEVPNQEPTAFISTPANALSVAQGTSISFAGSGNDPEDGALSGASLVWSSDRDGQIGTGTSFDKSDLSAGAHVIRLTATDSRGATFSHNRTLTVTAVAVNQSPSASISAPTNGASVAQGSAVSFAGSANDPEDGALSGASLVWSSDRDGQIGTGASFTTSALTVGAHTVTLTARDAAGATATATRSISVTAVVANESPSAQIATPANAASYVQGTSVSFTGSGNDPEDGALSGASLVWTSDRDGQIGTGTSFSRSNLSVGAHLIRLMATDAQGATFSHYRNLTITSAPVTPAPVASITVSLGATSIAVGATTTATSSLRDALGLILTGRVVTWSSSNTAVATVNSSGTVTGVSAGTASIRATSEGITGQTTVTVTSTTPPPPPPSGGSAEPSGMTLISDHAFNCLNPSSCEPDWWRQEGVAGTLTLATDASAPRSAGSVYQQLFTSALPGGSSPGSVGKYLNGANRKQVLYTAYWMKLSSNWVGHPTGVNKNMFFPVDSYNRIYTMLQGSGSGALRPAIGLQGLPQAYYSPNEGWPVTATSVNLYPNVGNVNIVRGQWHKYEIVFDAGTAGVANGSVQMWVDGVKVMNYTGIMFAAPGGSARWEAVSWAPIWGGAGGTITSPFYAQLDHLYISGK